MLHVFEEVPNKYCIYKYRNKFLININKMHNITLRKINNIYNILLYYIILVHTIK